MPNVDRALSDMETGIGVAAPPISNNVEARRLEVTDIGSGASTYWAGGVYLSTSNSVVADFIAKSDGTITT